jgi:hypothetical protein
MDDLGLWVWNSYTKKVLWSWGNICYFWWTIDFYSIKSFFSVFGWQKLYLTVYYLTSIIW